MYFIRIKIMFDAKTKLLTDWQKRVFSPLFRKLLLIHPTEMLQVKRAFFRHEWTTTNGNLWEEETR